MRESTPPPAQPTHAAVLLVDDNAKNLVALRSVLEPLGCGLVQAPSGRHALRELLHREFAVVLLDVMMPGMDGFETARLVKARGATRGIPIIFLTAHHLDEEQLLRAYIDGAVDVLVKPLRPEIVRAKVSVFVDLYLQRLELQRRDDIILKRETESTQSRELYHRERLARASAEAAMAAREQLLSAVSHDLRNPIAVVSASLDVIATHARRIGGADAILQLVDRGKRATSAMDRLVSDLVELARTDAGQPLSLTLDRVGLGEIARDVLELMRPICDEKQHDITLVASSCWVNCDPGRITRVLMNLVSNACKFTPARGRIQVQVSCRGEETLVAVEDTGPGVPASEVERIFDAFRRGQVGNTPGFGLGLAIARSFVHAHGGRIWVEAAATGGARFCFTLPTAVETAS